jgi:hypothetical protein
MKKILSLVLCALLVLGMFTACGNSGTPETTTQAGPTEPAEEAKVLKVLTLGHSLAVDSCHMINMIAALEGIGEYEEIVIGTLYYSGCRLSQHVSFLQADSPEYNLYLSSTKTPDQPPKIMDAVTMMNALKFDYWDIIVMQAGGDEVTSDKDISGNIKIIQDYVNEHKFNPLAYFAWHMTWSRPADVELLDMYPHSPNGHKEAMEGFGFSREKYFDAIIAGINKKILTDDSFQFVIPCGTAMQNAWSSYMEDKDIHRDYAHASDFGRAMTAYVWYCKLMGIDHLDEIKLDAIPKQFLKSTVDKTQDRVLTEMEKAVMLEAINNALANPLQMTQSQYTEAPTE